MMKLFAVLAMVLVMAAASLPALAEDELVIGGDVYTGGAAAAPVSAERDAFAYGGSVHLDGDVGKDAHAVGFDVDVDSRVGADLYVAGASVTVRGEVAEDVSATGFSVRLDDDASVGGNVRIAGARIKVSAPVAGSLLAVAGRITLNAPVGGDVRLTARDIDFGPEARIAGTLTYAAADKPDIPASVIPADRVRQVPFTETDLLGDLRQAMDEEVPSFWPSFFGLVAAFIVTLGFFVAVAAVSLSFWPDTVERLRARAMAHPGHAELAGFFGLALIAGLIPASALTLVGLPLIPFVLLSIFLLWLAGYLLGAYAVSIRIWQAFVNEAVLEEPIARRLAPLAVGLVVLAVLNFIPFAGWLVNLAIVFLGIGTIVLWALDRTVAGKIEAPAQEHDRVGLNQSDT